MNAMVHRSLVVGLLVLSAACARSAPTAPTAAGQPAAPPLLPPPPPPVFPPPSGASRTFTFERELTYHVHDYTKQSRFVLYDNGAFVLQYIGLSGEYRGGYTSANGVIDFKWEGSGAAAPWSATGTLTADSLTIRYNLNMELSDFDNAVYTLRP